MPIPADKAWEKRRWQGAVDTVHGDIKRAARKLTEAVNPDNIKEMRQALGRLDELWRSPLYYGIRPEYRW